MIPVKELRIGNHVKHSGYPNSIFSIRSISQDQLHPIGLIEHDKNTIYAIDCTLDDLEPIILNAEILMKYGFEWKDNYLMIDLQHARQFLAFCGGQSSKMTLFQYQGATYDSAVLTSMHFGANHPSYLHELQNLFFSLSGGEELI